MQLFRLHFHSAYRVEQNVEKGYIVIYVQSGKVTEQVFGGNTFSAHKRVPKTACAVGKFVPLYVQISEHMPITLSLRNAFSILLSIAILDIFLNKTRISLKL